MILGHDDIVRYIEDGSITVSPFDRKMVGSNSLDVRLGDSMKVLRHNAIDDAGEVYIDPEIPQIYDEISIPKGGLILETYEDYLGFTVEIVGSDEFVPIYEGRSSIGRMFLFSHVCAGFGDLGFKAQWTLEIFCRKRIMVKPGMKLGQIYFSTASCNSKLYGRDIPAHYANQAGPTESKYGEKI